MKISFGFIIVLLFIVGCNNSKNLTEAEREALRQAKLNSLVDEQLATIDMNAVDTYPLFSKCSDTLVGEAQKKCFETEFYKLLQEALQSEKLEVAEPINDTMVVYVAVNNKGDVVLERIEAADKTRELMPNLDAVLTKHLEGLPDIKPALKNGVEVSIQYALPLVVKVVEKNGKTIKNRK